MSLIAELRDYAGFLGEAFKFFGLPNCAGQRFFAIHVLAFGNRPGRDRVVHVVGDGNEDGVDFLVLFVEHYAKVAVTRNVGELFISSRRAFIAAPRFLGSVVHNVAEGDEVDGIEIFFKVFDGIITASADTDKSHV